jgi:AraC-like DNA-binding protein
MKPGEMVKLSWNEMLHFLPAVIMLINILPHLLLSHEAKMQFSQELSVNQLKLYDLNTLFFPIQLNLLIRPFLGFFYSLAALSIYFKYKEPYVSNEKLNVNANSLSWFFLLIVCTGLNFLFSSLVSVYAAIAHIDSSAMGNIKLTMLIPSFFLVIVNVSIFFYPSVIYGLIKRKNVKKEFSPEKLVFNDFVNSPLQNLINSVDVENNNVVISRKLADYFSSKPFLQPGFTLSIITQETNIPYHQLTTYYNNYLGINFNDWKNNARIDHAMDLIKNGRAKNLTLESIAYTCGFLSRSNFVNSFRKKTGLTPSEFLRSIPQESIVVSMDF